MNDSKLIWEAYTNTSKVSVKQTNDTEGTSLQGHVDASYNQLVEVFGKPSYKTPFSETEKITTAWDLEFPSGVIVTIYNWKNYENYGKDPEPDEEYEWHVGGYDQNAVYLVKNALKQSKGSNGFVDKMKNKFSRMFDKK